MFYCNINNIIFLILFIGNLLNNNYKLIWYDFLNTKRVLNVKLVKKEIAKKLWLVKMVDALIIGLLCDGHILLEGVLGPEKAINLKFLKSSVHYGSFAKPHYRNGNYNPK